MKVLCDEATLSTEAWRTIFSAVVQVMVVATMVHAAVMASPIAGVWGWVRERGEGGGG